MQNEEATAFLILLTFMLLSSGDILPIIEDSDAPVTGDDELPPPDQKDLI